MFRSMPGSIASLHFSPVLPGVICFYVVASFYGTWALATDAEFTQSARPLVQQYCFDCHSGADAEARVDLARLARGATFHTDFKTWRKVITVLEQQRMPPQDAQQPTGLQRERLAALVRQGLQTAAERSAGDPGVVVLRRLTSSEYAYSVADLTGMDLDLQLDSIGDAVGGEGFTNFGGVQFVQDAILERYLEVAKQIAGHAVVGTGPLRFFKDPGKTGFELSAIARIQQIYRAHGFRRASGEGGEPFGLDRYPRSFFAAWRYLHRERLGAGAATLDSIAAAEGLDARFVKHIWSVLTDDSPSFPTAEIVKQWRRLPVPSPTSATRDATVRAACKKLYRVLDDWQSRLAQTAGHEEEAAVLTAGAFTASETFTFQARIVWPVDANVTEVRLSVIPANPGEATRFVVRWQNPRVSFRAADRQSLALAPLESLLSASDREQFVFRRTAADSPSAAESFFVTRGSADLRFRLPRPSENVRAADLLLDAQLDFTRGTDAVVRAAIAWGTPPLEKKSISALLANPRGAAFQSWRQGVLDFARQLPQVSHREPAPSDRDPIPAPFDNTYNVPERDFFHYKVKYHRDDQFLVEHVLDDSAKRELDQAWHDLLASFEYHDVFLQFVADKFQLELGKRGIAALDDAWVERLADEPRRHVSRLRHSYRQIQTALAAAQPGHLEDVFRFASRAWRRPLTEAEQHRLRSFYQQLRQTSELDHTPAIRALLARVLTSPDFLYRVEKPLRRTGVFALDDWALAARLSYFLWSSVPDAELRRAAAAGELRLPQQLADQAQRMLRDPKARRLADEFFGQWLGFYRFDHYRGVDPGRFPEFDEDLKQALHAEAVAFFEYIVRHDRPLNDILFADYTFLNDRLAAHYGLASDLVTSGHELRRVEGLRPRHRGGLLGLGAVLTATSAPLRTSAVRRGDWLLRRVLGTPVPPPPADAGSIPADDVLADGRTVRERLAAHRRDPSCTNCHARIDPLGFALENYDALGRWRDHYRDGRDIDVTSVLHNGTPISGPEGLRRHLRSCELQFARTLCTKLLGYALGRSETLADQMLIDRMLQSWRNDGRFSELVRAVVTSRQFRYRRGDSVSGT